MSDFFKHFIDLTKDKTTSLGFKTAIFIFIISFVFVSDYYLGFSYNYHINNKIEQLEKVSNLKSKYETNSIKIIELNNIEKRIFKKKHYSEHLYHFFVNNFLKSEIIAQNNPDNNNPTNITNKPIRSFYLMLLSSSFFLIIFLFFWTILPLIWKIFKPTFKTWFTRVIKLGTYILIITFICYLIPLILNEPIYNYILNFILQIIVFGIIIIIGKYKSKKTKVKINY